jgi:hypothetical protein
MSARGKKTFFKTEKRFLKTVKSASVQSTRIFNQIPVWDSHRFVPLSLGSLCCCIPPCAVPKAVVLRPCKSSHPITRHRCQCLSIASEARYSNEEMLQCVCIVTASAHMNQQIARMVSVGFSTRRMADFAALALFWLQMALVASQTVTPFRVSSLSPNSIASSGGMFISVHAANGGLLSK